MEKQNLVNFSYTEVCALVGRKFATYLVGEFNDALLGMQGAVVALEALSRLQKEMALCGKVLFSLDLDGIKKEAPSKKRVRLLADLYLEMEAMGYFGNQKAAWAR